MLRRDAICLAILMALSSPAEAASIGRCGGNGGPSTASLSCPSGQYIIGLSAVGGRYVDKIGVRCAAFNPAGVRGPQGYSGSAGGSGGDHSASATCTGNAAIARMLARGASWLDAVANFRCDQRKPAGGFEKPASPGAGLMELNVGGFRGEPCRLSCPEGQAMHMIKVRYGSWVDSIEVFCRP
jgi:hypothetical protein